MIRYAPDQLRLPKLRLKSALKPLTPPPAAHLPLLGAGQPSVRCGPQMLQYSKKYHYLFELLPQSWGEVPVFAAGSGFTSKEIHPAVRVETKPRELYNYNSLKDFIRIKQIPGSAILICVYTCDSYGVEKFSYLDGDRHPLKSCPGFYGIARLMKLASDETLAARLALNQALYRKTLELNKRLKELEVDSGTAAELGLKLLLQPQAYCF